VQIFVSYSSKYRTICAPEEFMRAATEDKRIAAARIMSEAANNYAPFIPLVVRL